MGEKTFRHFVDLFKDACTALGAFIAFTPATFYFWGYWRAKERIREYLRKGAVVFLSFSFFLFVMEVTLELLGHEEVLGWLRSSHDSTAALALEAAFIFAVLVILFHNGRELFHIRTEYIFAEKIWALLESRGSRNDPDYVSSALELIYGAFSQFGAERVSIWASDGSRASIPDGWSYPSEGKIRLTSLPLGDGIAGHIFGEANPRIRYVPRLGFPFNSRGLSYLSWRFPHALTFQTVRPEEKGMPNIESPSILEDQVYLDQGWRSGSLRSFVVVPLTAKVSRTQCLWAMSIDFRRTDPLGREQIKMAASLATVVADEMDSRRGAQNRPSAA